MCAVVCAVLLFFVCVHVVLGVGVVCVHVVLGVVLVVSVCACGVVVHVVVRVVVRVGVGRESGGWAGLLPVHTETS